MKVESIEKLSLKKVKIEGNVVGKFGIFEIEQTFINNLKDISGVEYTLPVVDTATIIGFEIDVGEEHLQGICKEYIKAIEEYHKNNIKGNNYYRLESDEENEFKLCIGRVNVGETVKIKVKYIDNFEIINNKLKIIIPALKLLNKKERDYTVEFNINLDKSLNYKSIESKSNNIELLENKEYTKVEIEDYDMAKDCRIDIELKDELSSNAVISNTSDNNKVVYISFIPDILEKYKEEEKEYVFLIDISKFMGQERLEHIKKSIIECLKKLKYGDKFNVLTYDSDFRAMELESIEYSNESLEKAVNYIEKLECLGSKRRIYNPLRFALYEKDVSKNILIFSYAEVVQEENVVDFIKDNINNSRIFFFGINYKFNKDFLRKIEKVGRGKSQLINSDEDFEDRIIRTFEKIQNPVLEDLEIDYGQNRVLEEIRKNTILFNHEFYDDFVKIDELEDDIKIKGKILGKEYTWNIAKEDIRKSNTDLEVLFAKEEIEKLQDCIIEKDNLFQDKEYKDKIKEISEKYNIPVMSSKFIIVYKKDNKLVEAPKYESDLVDYEEPKEGKLKKALKFIFRVKEDDEEEGIEEYYDEFQKGFIDDDIIELDDEKTSLVDKLFKRDKVEEDAEDEEKVYIYDDIENEVDEYYKEFINKKENKSILTYILLAIFYLDLENDENKFRFNNFITFLEENKEKILESDLYQKLLCVLYRGVINRNDNEGEAIFKLLSKSYKKALVTELEMPINLKKISNKDYEEILEKKLVKENIDKVLIKRCWKNINFDVRGTLLDFFNRK